MPGLKMDHFTRAGHDYEGAQYRIMHELTDTRRAFARSRIYPYLGNLINVYNSLQLLTNQLTQFREAAPGEIKRIDLASGTIIRETTESMPEMSLLEDLIAWALPHIQETIEEGRVIFEFVEENLFLSEVGLLPSYVEEGYLIVPDLQQRTQHILRYQLSLITDVNERYRSLKTTHLRTVNAGIKASPRQLKLELIASCDDLPNPATYVCTTDLDFPFEETMLPIAKRKLMQYLFRHSGSA